MLRSLGCEYDVVVLAEEPTTAGADAASSASHVPYEVAVRDVCSIVGALRSVFQRHLATAPPVRVLTDTVSPAHSDGRDGAAAVGAWFTDVARRLDTEPASVPRA